ncbi:hypothetical protein CDAR_114821 [Caerostris darwini]|uniref:Uncharacterized protein n=1 Tax=Caerostris darwini TaxID=1538125 RepID=A0AAV4MEC6_9ARAC|nr:hypothetical protein CDAR_114821 [Caerostris darwini]
MSHCRFPLPRRIGLADKNFISLYFTLGFAFSKVVLVVFWYSSQLYWGRVLRATKCVWKTSKQLCVEILHFIVRMGSLKAFFGEVDRRKVLPSLWDFPGEADFREELLHHLHVHLDIPFRNKGDLKVTSDIKHAGILSS